MRIRPTLALLVVAASLLGACHKHREPPPENQAIETPVPAPQPPEPAPEPTPKPAPEPASPKPKAAPKATAEEQMLDDADATGMTSHASRDTDTPESSSGNSPQ